MEKEQHLFFEVVDTFQDRSIAIARILVYTHLAILMFTSTLSLYTLFYPDSYFVTLMWHLDQKIMFRSVFLFLPLGFFFIANFLPEKKSKVYVLCAHGFLIFAQFMLFAIFH
ncbi:hypothetical protein UABAM_03507 [Candidatus Uabimicrobium amorphum]|uniref:Uncharacterized protein n=1 Tax=Uabimicrobium amorphum TaxID=2596890 RepID=A0A5S9F538_UABAM|nr:hypothetical protein UABAM_03507 [Candidatus Uabimicrobium amorphum]